MSANKTEISNHNLPLGSLVLRCREQTSLYLKRERYDPESCYEIWRRAIQEKNHDAWEAIYHNYSGFVRNWLQRQTNNLAHLNLEEDALVNGVFFRMMRFVKPENFGNFPNLAAVMKYLQMCCLTEVQDTLRDYQARSRDVSLEANVGGDEDTNGEGNLSQAHRISSGEDVEKDATQRADRSPFWKVVERHLPDRGDQLVIYARYVYQMPPRDIAQSYPQYFKDVTEVYRRLKNATWRLRNDSDLEAWLQEFGG